MSQDQIYKYLTEHNVILSRIAELMDITPSSLVSDFTHRPNRHGDLRSLTLEHIQKLNDALHSFAQELRDCQLHFGTDNMYTNKRGRVYDPGMIEAINEIGWLINTTALMEQL